MKRVLALLAAAFWLGSSVLPAATARRAAIHAPAANRDYVRVADWARTRGLQPRWLKREETLQLVNPSTRVTLTVDSQEAEINGVEVRLLFPAVYRDAQLYLSQLD